MTVVAGLANIQVGDLTPFVDGTIAVVQAFFALVSAIAFVWGFVRKIVLTIQGRNQVVL